MKQQRVLITGAAGRLGSTVFKHLAENNFDVVGVDKVPSSRLENRNRPPHFYCLDLTDFSSCANFIHGFDAVVHFANWPHASANHPNVVLGDNLKMNANIFGMAIEIGVRKVIFSSSIQVVTGIGMYKDAPPLPEYLPLDDEYLARPGNHYALSKRLTELMLSNLCERQADLQAMSLRFPVLISRHYPWKRKDLSGPAGSEAYSMLQAADAAKLTELLLNADWAGHKIAIPADKTPTCGVHVQELLAADLAGIPVKSPSLTALTHSEILQSLGWVQPQTSWDSIL